MNPGHEGQAPGGVQKLDADAVKQAREKCRRQDDEDDIGAVAHRSGNKSRALPEAQE
jgi:hypothetical protein